MAGHHDSVRPLERLNASGEQNNAGWLRNQTW
jgi:hypothetical protein